MEVLTNSYMNNIADVYENANTASELQNRITNSDYSQASDAELMEVCKEFEAYFLEQVFKGMEKMIPKNDDEDSSVSQTVDYFKDTMIQQIAADTVDTQSLGLAQILYESMKRDYNI